jgi:hypothetical protein
MAPRPVVVLVCGEPRRGDDAAAFAAIDRLPADVRANVDIRPVGSLDVDDIVSIDAGAACLIVDAALGPGPVQSSAERSPSLASREDDGRHRRARRLRGPPTR